MNTRSSLTLPTSGRKRPDCRSFSPWYAANEVSEADRENVADYFDKNLTSNLSDPSGIHRRKTEPGLSLEQIGSYIRNFVYRLGDVELEGCVDSESWIPTCSERSTPRDCRTRSKVLAGDRLTSMEGLRLLEETHLLELGALANEVRFVRHPEPIVTYVVDTNLNYTNLCDAYCSFCAFYRPHTSTASDAYTHTVAEMVEAIGRARDLGCTTVLMQGGLNPELPLSYYTDMVRASLETHPDVTPHFWSPPEITR